MQHFNLVRIQNNFIKIEVIKYPLTIRYNNLSLPVVKGFTEAQIFQLMGIAESKEQCLTLLNAITDNIVTEIKP